MMNAEPSNDQEIVNSLLARAYSERGEVTKVRQSAFKECSYCSSKLKSGSKLCKNCHYVYCRNCIVADYCAACADRSRYLALGDPVVGCVGSVVVVGGGIAGLSTALALRNRGAPSVVVLERSAGLQALGGGINVQNNALAAFLDIDPSLVVAVKEMGGQLGDKDGGFLSASGKLLFNAKPDLLTSRWGLPAGTSASRAKVQELLYRRCTAAGVVVEFGCKVIDVEETSDSVNVVLESGRCVQGDLLVGADGMWSKVRAKLFDTSPPIYCGYQMILGTVPKDKFDQMTTPLSWGEYWGTGTRFGFFRNGEDGMTWYFGRNAPAEKGKDATKEELQDEVLKGLKRGFPKVSWTIGLVQESRTVQCVPLYHVKPMKVHAKNRVVVIGDAANGMPPNLGQGACMAIESSSVFAQCVVVSSSIEEAFKKYNTRRVLRCNTVQSKSLSNGKIFQTSNPAFAWLRNALFAYLGKKAEKPKSESKAMGASDPFGFLFSYRVMAWPPKGGHSNINKTSSSTFMTESEKVPAVEDKT